MSVTVKIAAGKLGAFIKASGRAAQPAMKRAAKRAAQRAVGHLKMQTPVDEGVMRAAWRVVTFSSGWMGIENAAPHAGIILKGARPHAVNKAGIDAIREWVIRKGLIQVVKKTKPGFIGPAQTRRISRKEADNEFSNMVDGIVWGIVNKLKKYGYKGNDFVEKSMPQMLAWVDTEVTHELNTFLSKPTEGGE